jgi:hypothetical protein
LRARLLLVARRAPERLVPERLVDRFAVERVPPPERLVVERFAPARLVERPLVAFFAVLFARLVVLLARLVAPRAERFAVPDARLFARLVVRLAFLAPAFARLVARLAVLLPLASACARVPAALAAAFTALPADVAARFAAGAAALDPFVALVTAARAERTASLPLFCAALAWRVAAPFFAAAERCAFV